MKSLVRMTILMVLCVVLFAACSGGGGGGGTPAATTPSVSSTNPAMNATNAAMTSTISVVFSVAMDAATINTTTFTVIDDLNNPVNGSVSYSGFTATFTPSTNLAPTTTYMATISTGAKSGNGVALANAYVWSFTTESDTVPPFVCTVNPLSQSTGAVTNSTVSAVFSEVMSSGTITASTFTLTDNAGNPVTGNVSYSGLTAIFTPLSNLSSLTTYTATITTGATDLVGNPLAANYSWSFTTGIGPDITPPSVSSTTPADLATGVSLTAPITATFSETMDGATLSATTFTVKDASNNPVTGIVSCAGQTATFTPTSALSYLKVYTATITTGAKDLAGNSPAANYTWSFTARDASWGTAVLVSAGTGSATSPRVTLDASGNALAVWKEWVGTKVAAKGSRAPAGSSWLSPVRLELFNQHVAYLELGANQGGNCGVILVQQNGSDPANNVYVNLCATTVGFGSTLPVETGAGHASNPHVAVGGSLRALALWDQEISQGSYTSHVNTNLYNSGWSAGESQVDNANMAYYSQVAANSGGYAVAVWSELGATSGVFAKIYSPATLWGTPALVSDGTGGIKPEVAIDASGNIVVVWTQEEGPAGGPWVYKVYGNRYAPGSGWGSPVVIGTSLDAYAYPKVAMDAGGNAIAVWSQNVGGYIYDIVASRYVIGTGWGSVAQIESGTQSAGQANITMDANGNAVVVWPQSDGSNSRIYANRYAAGTGWSTAAVIDDGQVDSSEPWISMTPAGKAIVVWSRYVSGVYKIYSNRFE